MKQLISEFSSYLNLTDPKSTAFWSFLTRLRRRRNRLLTLSIDKFSFGDGTGIQCVASYLLATATLTSTAERIPNFMGSKMTRYCKILQN